MTTTTEIYKHVQLRHGRTRYIDVGTGPPLILLHQSSIEGGADDYLACLPHLSPHFRVLVPDLLGWPPSDTQDDIDAFPFLVDFLRQFQDALGLDRSHVCGVSMGGWIAGLLAYESPERIDKVIISGHPFTGSPNRNMLDYTVDSVTADDGVREWLTKVAQGQGADVDALVQEKLAKMHEPGFADAFVKVMRSMGAPANRQHYAMVHRLPQLRVPALILLGDRDKAAMSLKDELSQKLAASSELRIIPSGHRMHVEDPEVFSAAVLDYLR
jgi:2-hydroxy-6-oxonona-2,4-dienedioate hydrolase